MNPRTRLRLAVLFWLLALLPAMAAVLYVQSERPFAAYWWTWMTGAWQIAIAEIVRRQWLQPRLGIGGFDGWGWALAVLIGLQALQYAVAVHAAPTLPASFIALELVKYFVFVAYAEEILFRGIWFEVCRRRLLPGVVVGSVLFGLYHLPHGWQAVAVTALVGGVFAVARYRGASILTLTLAHGLIDWLNLRMWPAASQRVDSDWFAPLFGAGCLLLALLLLYWRRGSPRG